MSIEKLIKKINEELIVFGDSGVPAPANSTEIVRLKQSFQFKFDYVLPLIFEELLGFSNGVLFNGLTIWPTDKYWLFQESLIEANSNLRESFNDQFLYLGTRDEELYVYNQSARSYQAIEYVGEAEWANFSDAEEMIVFMLTRSLE